MSEVDRREFITRAAGSLAAIAVLPELGLARVPSAAAGIKVGLVGVGRHGRAILGELARLPGVEVAAICETDERRLNSGLRRAARADGFATLGEMLEGRPDIEALIVATPTHTHRAVAETCFETGKHVYLECPLAHTIEDCAAISAAAKAAPGTIAAGFQGRSNPVYKLARGFFKTDSVRDPVAFRAQRHEKTSLRTPSNDPARERALNWILDPERSIGLAGEWGSQQFDVYHWYTGKYPEKIRGRGAIHFWDDGRETPDTISCELVWPENVVLQYSATLANSFDRMYEVFCGTNAAIKLSWSHGWMFKEADAPTQGWEVYANRQQFHDQEGITLIAGATQLAEQGKLKEGVGLPYSSLFYALADWVAAIEDGTTPACTIDEAARGTAVGIFAHRAVMSGDEVAVDFSAL